MICGRGWFYWKGLLVLWTIVSTLSLDLSSCPVEESDCKNTMMKSISHNEADGSVKLETNTPIPSLKDGDVLIKVVAAGVNRLDLSQVKGQYPPPPGDSEILGVEVSGTVASLSPLADEKSGLKEGDRVMALIGGGGYAEYCVAPYQCVMTVPNEIDFEQAAAIPEVYITAYQALVWNGYLQDGDSILIHAAASGVGTAAIQMAKAICSNVTVFATSRTETKLPICAKCGADVLINTSEQDFAEEVLKATGGKGVNLIIDFIGGPYWEKNLECIATDGRLMIVSLLGGPVSSSPMTLGPILKKRLTVRGSTLRTRSLDYKGKIIAEIIDKLLPFFTTGELWPVMDQSFPIERTEDAHKRMQANLNSGKIVLTL